MRAETKPAPRGWTAIPNVMIDAFKRGLRWTLYEQKVFWEIVSRTIRWHKPMDWISLSQFEKETGVDRRNVYRAIRSLEKRNIIIVDKSNPKKPKYGVQTTSNMWNLDSV